jgi:hypothetical protein
VRPREHRALFVAPDVLDVFVPSGGRVPLAIPIPNTPSLAGAVLHEQVVPIEFDFQANITLLTSSNALTVTIGAL